MPKYLIVLLFFGCTKVIVPDRVYFDTSDSLVVKTFTSQVNGQLEIEYKKVVEDMRIMNKSLSDSNQVLNERYFEMKDELKFVRSLCDSLRRERNDLASDLTVKKLLLDKCRDEK